MLLIRLLWVMCVFPAVANAAGITIKGSDTMILLCQKWAETYMRENAGADIQVTGGGSGTGIAALRNGATDVASASRQMKPEEVAGILAAHGQRPLEVRTAMDGICVFVNQDNPLKEISFAQLSKIFRGQVQNWSEVGGPNAPIVVYSRENNSGTYAYFKEVILKDEDYSARALTMPGTAALINAISKDKNGIGYGGVGYASGVKVLPVKKGEADEPVLPTDETIRDSKYPISRYLYFYVLPDSKQGELARFIDWVLGPGGQAVVKEVGYFPLAAATAAIAPVPVPPPNLMPATSVMVTPTPATAVPAAPAASLPVAPVVVSAPVPAPAPVAAVSSATTVLDALIEREVMLAKREMTTGTREEALAKREGELAAREKQISVKDSELNQREADLKQKEQEYEAKRAKHASWYK